MCDLVSTVHAIPRYRLKYASTDGMYVSRELMKGMVAKHIERRNFFHSNDVHWKWLIVKLTG